MALTETMENTTDPVASVPPPTNDWMSLPAFQLSMIARIAYTSIFLPLGTVGNALSFVVMTRKAMKSYATSVFLSALAIFDILVLYLDCLLSTVSRGTGVFVDNQNDALCKTFTFVKHMLLQGSSWLLVLVALERLIAVLLPFQAKRVCTLRNCRLAVCATFLVLVLITLRVVFLRGINGRMKCAPYAANMWFSMYISSWIVRSLYYVVPVAVMIGANATIVLKIRLNTKRPARKKAVATNTLIMLVSTTAFVLTTTPQFTFYLVYPGYSFMAAAEKARLAMSSALVEGVYYSNNVLNFWIYVATSPRFKRELRSLFGCGKQRVGPGASLANESTI